MSPGTKLFSTGDITIDNSSDVFTNKGDIKISEGTLKNNALPDKFVLTYTDEKHYGQLIIASNKSASGKITIQKQLFDDGSGQILFGTPFVNYTYDQFYQNITNSTSTSGIPELICYRADVNNNCRNSKNWAKHPVFKWRDEYFRFDPFQSDENFVPGNYYAFKKAKFDKGSNFNNPLSFTGTPYVAGTKPANGNIASTSDLSLHVSNRVANGRKIGNNRENEYGIYYWTYLSDPFVTDNITFDNKTDDQILDNVYYADRMLHLVNPYTSNINIEELVKSNSQYIIGLGSEGPITNVVNDGVTRYKQKMQLCTYENGSLVGDSIAIIPPMTNFFLKTNTDDVNINLYNADIQTFSQSDYKYNRDSIKEYSIKRVNTDKYQLNLELFSGKTFYGNTYIAAGANFITGNTNRWEAKNSDNIIYETNIYTIPESPNGGKLPGHENTKLYINVINTDNASRIAVPVGINVLKEDRGKQFTFKSDLRLNMNALKKGQTNFDNPNARFYFHDKDLNVIKEIDSNFSYSVTINESTNDRFEIFWKEPGTLGNEDINTLNSLTTIYKTGNEYKIHFDQNWSKAEVNIFNVLGQLISTEKNITTQNDYLLPIHTTSSSLYVIVVTNSITGEKITKKIVK
ncbi:T9SS type A sorting domain-containing protein [Apibacter mensalis]|uniref:T9SS type A sorting domain-containing protein n=1 Tax=Apibacter mensalis TaxID=1586267 RepID=UPI0026F0B277|nr:hypothetical protein [Apibacter mensalis]